MDQRAKSIEFRRFKCGGYPYFQLRFISNSGLLLGQVANWSDRDVEDWITTMGREKADETSGVIELLENEIIAGMKVGTHKDGWLVNF